MRFSVLPSLLLVAAWSGGGGGGGGGGGCVCALVASLHPAQSDHVYTTLHIRGDTIPAGTRWFRLLVNSSLSTAVAEQWFMAGGSTASVGTPGLSRVLAVDDTTFTFRPLPYSEPIKTSRAEASVTLEAWSGRGGLPDNQTADLLNSSLALRFVFDDNGWSSTLGFVNFSFSELQPGWITIAAVPNNLTAWARAKTVTWYGAVPTGISSGFTEDNLQSAVIHSTRSIVGNHPALNRSYSRPGLYFVELYGAWNGEYDWGEGGWQPDVQTGVKTDSRFPLDRAGKFQPAAIVIPFENGTRPSLPQGFTGPVHIGSPIPGDFRLALNVEHVTVFSGGSLHLPCADAKTGSIVPLINPLYAEFDVPRGLQLLNASDLCFPHDCHPNPVHEVSHAEIVADGGRPVPAGYWRLRITRAAGQWSWLNQAIKLQVHVADQALQGRTFPLARVRAYSSPADRRRPDNWQKLALTVVKLEPIVPPRRLRTDFGWDYLREFPTDETRGLSSLKTWKALGFNTIPALGATNYVPPVNWPGWKSPDPGELLTLEQRASDPTWAGLRYDLHLSPFRSGGFLNPPHGMGSFQALTLPPETADSELDPPLGFNFSAAGLTATQERIERRKWKNALLFWNDTKHRFGRGRLDLSYDGWFYHEDIAAALAIINYTKPDFARFDIESFEHTLQDYVNVGWMSANFDARKLVNETDGAVSVRIANDWVGRLIKLAKDTVPNLMPDLYDVSAIDGQGYQINTWSSMAEAGAPASPCDYYRLNLLDRLAATVRNERLAILASHFPAARLRPTLGPGETPGVDGLAIYLGTEVTPYAVLFNQLIQVYAAGATVRFCRSIAR